MADAPTPEDVVWSPEGAPRSGRFDDVYFSGDGLAESRAVFLGGCGLPEAWAGRRRFTVAELGFGTGLNILALLSLWRAARPAGGRLQVFSVEAYPMSTADAARALSAFPELRDLAAPMIERWPTVRRGWVRFDYPELGAVVDLAIGEVAGALTDWTGTADAWFLDGFAPSRNPEMWRAEVLNLVAARSAPGARVATFTVAGVVRRGLAERGFAVSREPGHGHKRQRLEARLPGEAPAASPERRIAVIGAGVAGAALARAFAAAGQTVTVFDSAPGQGASGAPSAHVAPRIDVGDGPSVALYAQAFARAVALYRAESGVVVAEGAVRLASGERDPTRFARLEHSDLFASGSLRALGAAEASALLGEPADEALWMAEALTISPARLLAAWLPQADGRRVVELTAATGGWLLKLEDGAAIDVDVVCLAAGPATAALGGLELEPVRGQLTWSEPLDARPSAVSWGGYSVPTLEGGLLFGATHQRGRTDTDLDDRDEATNLQALEKWRPALAAAIRRAGPLRSRAGVRAATRDRFPLAGALGPGLFVLSGLGGRGFTTAPLLAEHVAALALGLPSPLPRPLAKVADPLRFQAGGTARKLTRPAS